VDQLPSPIGTPEYPQDKRKQVKESRFIQTSTPTEKHGFGYKVSFEEAIPNKATLAVSQVDKYIGEQAYPSFSTLWNYKTLTPQLETIITYETDMIVGTDLNINSDNESIKQILEDWTESISLYEKLKSHTALSLALGFGLLVKVRGKKGELVNIEEFDVTTIKRAFRDLYGNIICYEQQISNDGKFIYYFTGNNKDIDAKQSLFGSERYNIDSFPIIFKKNGRSAFGLSEFHALAVPRSVVNRQSRPLAEALWSLDDVVIGTLENFAYPTEYHVFEGANDDDLLAEAQKLKDSKPGDKFIMSRMHAIDRREPTQAKFDSFIGHFTDILQHGTGFPLDMLTGDFASRASSQTADSFFMRKIRSYQKYLTKTIQKEILEDKLRSLGYSELQIKRANVTVEFEVQSNKDYTPEIVGSRVSTGIWTKAEARQYDKANGQDLFDDDKIEQQEEQTQQDLIPVDDKKGGFVMKPRIVGNVRKEKRVKEGFGDTIVYRLDYGHDKFDECDNYSEQEYEVGDQPELPIHPNCKCYYEDGETGEYLGQDPEWALSGGGIINPEESIKKRQKEIARFYKKKEMVMCQMCKEGQHSFCEGGKCECK